MLFWYYIPTSSPLMLNSALTCITCVEFASEDCEFYPFIYVVGNDAQILFATDCADTSVIRTPSRQELLYARSQIVIAAKAFGLNAIDMVGDDHTSAP